MNGKYNIVKGLHEPCYVVEESLLRSNLNIIRDVADKANVEIILAFKAFALWKTFSIFREYIGATTASSYAEARLAFEEFGSLAHTYAPAYTDYEIADIAHFSSHLTFNSLSQYLMMRERAKVANPNLSFGLRVNPEYSEIETELYNPCAVGSRFGVLASDLPCNLPEDIEGFHCHCHCESGADAFQRTLVHIEEKFSKWFPQLKWINFGGGHLMTREGYDLKLLVSILNNFHKKYPNLKVIMEPGSAFAWQTGYLVAQVVDIVVNHGVKTAILNVSFTCHMPDCLEMPYQPFVVGAKSVADKDVFDMRIERSPYIYRLGGNSCLSGDYMGAWCFDHKLKVGESVVFEDMIHYTTVKTNMFNGVSHPNIAILRENGSLEILRKFGYEDYKKRMD